MQIAGLSWFVAVGAVTAQAGEPSAFVRLMNVGGAQLENRDSAKAIEAYTEAVKLKPSSAPALRNLARAQLLGRKHEAGIESLDRARKLDPDSVAGAYLTGLAQQRLSRFAEAIPHFEKAVRLDPQNATLRFQLAGAQQAAGHDEKAVEQLLETVRLDPLHASAHYKLGTYARKDGDKDEFRKRHREFMRLRKLFGEASRSAEALEICVYTAPESPFVTREDAEAPPPIDVRYVDATAEALPTDEVASAVVAAVIDVSERGIATLFAVDPKSGPVLMRMGADGVFVRSSAGAALPAGFVPTQCLVGDFHDDVPEGEKYDPKRHPKQDVLLVGEKGVRLLKGVAADRFEDVTDAAGLAGLSARRARWIDYEHDGDLDLLLARATGMEVWQNNGDATFKNVTADIGIGATGAASDACAVDLDDNVAVDIVTARGTEPSLVFTNQQAGRFARMPEPPGPLPPARHIVADDLDNDGRMDLVLVGDSAATILFGRTPKRTRIDLEGIEAPAVALADYDNDGWLDLLAYGAASGGKNRGVVRLLRGVGSGKWTDVTTATRLDGMAFAPVTNLVAADLDRDGDTDLLLVTGSGRLRYLRNDGGHANGQLKVRLVGLKTNPSGIGTRVELRDEAFRITRLVDRPGIALGLAGHRHADSVRTLWTNGVVDHQIDVTLTDAPLMIIEKNVATGSCPFLYAWDGTRHRFVTDILGNSPLGLSLTRDVILPADPDEIVYIGGADVLAPRDGQFVLTITDEFREALYLDEVRLIAVDHRVGEEVHPTDKMMAPLFPPSEVWAFRAGVPPRRATGDDGVDRTDALRAIDAVFAPPGIPLPPPLRGTCRPMRLTLDFGPIDTDRPMVLALTGWLQYGDASTNIALSQSKSFSVIPPSLEVETEPGTWTPLDVIVGMPAGKTKTILCDLTGKLPQDARRLRLTTTFEIRWDRIALCEQADLSPRHVHELPPATAELSWRGFSEIRSRGPGHPTTPDFETVFARPPWRSTLEGWCTRYGDVLELVSERDERIAIVNGGDAVTLAFDADGFPPVPPGLTRSFLFYSVGWDKDADHNVVQGDTIEPLPIATSAWNPATMDDVPPDDWRTEYNTRWVPADRFADPP